MGVVFDTFVLIKSCMSLLLVFALLYQFLACFFILERIVGWLASLSVILFLIFGNWNICLMNVVCIVSQGLVVFFVVVMVAVWPYSNSGRT